MSTTPSSYQGTNIEGVDWHGPIVDIVNDLYARRFADSESQGEVAMDECLEWAEIVATKFVQSLHPHLVGRV